MLRNEKAAPLAAQRRRLYRAVLALRSPRECEKFFEDLCSVSELDAMAARFHMARELRRGRTYLQVSRLTRSSTTTVTRAARWLKYGKGGFQLALDRLEGGANTRKRVSRGAKITMRGKS